MKLADPFPVVSSLPSTDALCTMVASAYDIGSPHQCLLWFAGTSDTYRITTERNHYMLRLYHAGVRTNEDVLYELAALQHLRQKGFSVAVPIQSRDGAWFHTIAALEGSRQLVLFTYAPGREAYADTGFAARFGRSIAEIHNATDDFHSPYQRFHLDNIILLERPLRWIQPLLTHHPTEWQELLNIAARLRQHIAVHATDRLNWGFCHGDALGSNAHLDGNTLTHFDFNDCGPGWRAYDLATYLWIQTWVAPDTATARWEEFLQGYRTIRPLAAADLAAVPVLVALRELWVVGQQVRAATLRGHWWVQDPYFAQRIAFLRAWEQQRLVDL